MRTPGSSRTACDSNKYEVEQSRERDVAPAQDAIRFADTYIVLIEPRALVRECVARGIRAVPGHFVTSFSSVESWLEVRERTQASLVVLCLPGPLADAAEQGGFEQLARAAEALPTVVMSDAEDLNSVLDAINKGARGFIPTSLPMEVVIEALRLVRAGGVFVPASSLIPALRTRDTRASAGGERNTIFTVRQAAVVDALRRGKANKTIAHELNMRESTVKVHVRNIMKKLSAKNRTEVALMTSRLMLEPARAG